MNQETSRIPIWIMRQAGRYMKAYQDLRKNYDFLTMVKTPELACEVTLQPIKEFLPDAAIIFADILPLLEAMGLGLEFTANDGPVILRPIKDEENIKNLRAINSFIDLSYTLQTIKLVKAELSSLKIPLIGFSGAPFTLAYYAIEGGGAKNNGIKTISLMQNRPELWHLMMEKINLAIIDYLLAQINSGVDALQLFDSWAGLLSPKEYEIYVLPHVITVVKQIKTTNIPITYFSTQTGAYLNILNRIPCQVLGIDWRIDIADAWQQKGEKHALQGNLSPHVLLGSEANVRQQTSFLLQNLRAVSPSLKGYIFNLGHGIHKETPVDNVHALFDQVRNFA
jgi:uroporphyrinogen decarboxylase